MINLYNIHTHMHTLTHIHTHSLDLQTLHAHKHTQTHTRTSYIHTHTHTHTHTQDKIRTRIRHTNISYNIYTSISFIHTLVIDTYTYLPPLYKPECSHPTVLSGIASIRSLGSYKMCQFFTAISRDPRERLFA